MATLVQSNPWIEDTLPVVRQVLAFVLPRDFPHSEQPDEHAVDRLLRTRNLGEEREAALWCYLHGIAYLDEEARPRAERAQHLLYLRSTLVPPLRQAIDGVLGELRGLDRVRQLIEAPPEVFVEAVTRATADYVKGLNRQPRRLSGLAAEDFLHPRDRESLDALKRMPAVSRLMDKVLDLAKRAQEIQLLADGLRVTPQSFPWLWQRYAETLEILGITTPPPLYIFGDGLEAGILGVDRPAVVVQSRVASFLDVTEVRFVLGRALGHLLAGHVTYQSLAELLYGTAGIVSEATLPLLRFPVDAALGLRLCAWCRASEFSADRVGYLACQSREAALRALIKQAGFPVRHYAALNTRALVQQAQQFRRQVDENSVDRTFEALGRVFNRMPYRVQRTAELLEWVNSGAYDDVLSRRWRV